MITAPEEEKIQVKVGKDDPLLDQKVLHEPIAKEVGESVAPPSLPENLGENLSEALGETVRDAKATFDIPLTDSETHDFSRESSSDKFLNALGKKLQKANPNSKVDLN